MLAAYKIWVRAPQTYCVVLDSAAAGIFCEGCDLAALRLQASADPQAATAALRLTAELAWQIDCFTKPNVPLINGRVAGAGVGISYFGTHQVAGEGYRLVVSGPAEGWLPDAGIAHRLARMPKKIGHYLALTGAEIGSADAFALGLLTHVIPAAHDARILAALADADPVDPLLDGLHRDPGAGVLAPIADAIAQCFAPERVTDVLARLDADASPWAQSAAARMRAASPMSLAITQRFLHEAAGLDLRDTLKLEYRIAVRRLQDMDFRAPGAWNPVRIEDVAEADVARYFAPLGADELVLATRAEMQATR